MSAEENVQIMRRWFQEVWNEGRIETIHELSLPRESPADKRAPKASFAAPRSSKHL
jgi:hypothetical protein